MSGKILDINNIDINELSKYFKGYLEGIDFDQILENDKHNKVNNQKKSIDKAKNSCSSCNGDNIAEDYSQGILVCMDCGQVLDNILDYNPEWKQFEDEDKSGGRCSLPINVLLPQSSLGTSISGMGKNRLKTLHSWNAMPYKERSLNNEFKKIHDVCIKAKILKCVEDDAKIMYKMASECRHASGKNMGKFIITRGVNRVSISAACVFFACIRKSMTRTSKEIASFYGIKDMEMNRGCKNLLKLLKNKKTSIKMGTSKPEHFVRRYCNELQIKNVYIEDALKIAKNIEKLNIASDHTPYSLAAASILLMASMSKLKSITKKKLANEFSISEVTISKTYKEIEAYKHVLTNNDVTDEIVTKIDNDMKQEDTPPEVLERMKKFGISSSTTNISSTTNATKKKEMTIDDFDESDSDFELEEDEEDEYCHFDYFQKKMDKVTQIMDKLKHTKYTDDIKLLCESSDIMKSMSADLNKYYKEL